MKESNKMSGISIGGRRVGRGHAPFVIAEMSGNHNQSLDRALAIVDAAAESGAHAMKIQTFTADTMTLDLDEREFFVSDPDNLWKGTSLYKLYDQAHTPWEWHEPIFERCRKLGMLGFSTPFDESSVKFLETLDVPCYKIASFENTDLPLIRKVAATGKPLIISTGMASIEELAETVACARAAGCTELVLLKCTSTYPANPKESNLLTIPHMQSLFDCEIGLSDHTMGIGVAVASIILGASVVEKHFTLSRAEGGVDSVFSLEPHEFRALVFECDRAWQARGEVAYGPTEKERASLAYRRSLYITENVKKGEVLTERNLRAIRPGLGLAPKFFDQLLGKTINRDVSRGTPVSWDLIG